MVERGLAESRRKAQAVIMAGQVYVNGQKVDKAGAPVAEDAYCLYGWLMEQLPSAYAAYLHEEGERPFCQYLLPSREERHRAVYQWTLFSEDAVQMVAPILLNSTSFPFRSGGKQVCVRRAAKRDVPL